MRAEGARVLAGLRSGDGPLSVRARPSGLKRDLTAGQRAQVKLPGERTREVTLDPGDLYGHSGQKTKGQAGACPDRTRAIPCKVRVCLLPDGLRRVDSNGDATAATNGKRQRPATAHTLARSAATGDIVDAHLIPQGCDQVIPQVLAVFSF